MRFDYTAIVSSAPDSGEPVIIFRPEIHITVHGRRGSHDFLALVDSGADNTIFPESIARSLDIPLRPAQGPAAKVFGGQEITLSYADVELQLAHGGEDLRWLARVYFLAGDADDDSLVLGHQGFLDYFTATFVGDQFALEMEPNDYLPRIAGNRPSIATK